MGKISPLRILLFTIVLCSNLLICMAADSTPPPASDKLLAKGNGTREALNATTEQKQNGTENAFQTQIVSDELAKPANKSILQQNDAENGTECEKFIQDTCKMLYVNPNLTRLEESLNSTVKQLQTKKSHINATGNWNGKIVYQILTNVTLINGSSTVEMGLHSFRATPSSAPTRSRAPTRSSAPTATLPILTIVIMIAAAAIV